MKLTFLFIFLFTLFNIKAQNIIKYQDNFKRVKVREIIKQAPNSTRKEIKDTITDFDILKKQFENLEKKKKAIQTKVTKSVKSNKLDFTLPLEVFKLSSHYGMRNHPITKKHTFHKGIDLKAKYVHVKSFLNGKVIKKGYSKSKGFYIHILSKKIETRYFHLSRILVKKGDHVLNGQIIAFSGNSGKSTAPHLHFETLLNKVHINPIRLISILKKQKTDAEFTEEF